MNGGCVWRVAALPTPSSTLILIYLLTLILRRGCPIFVPPGVLGGRTWGPSYLSWRFAVAVICPSLNLNRFPNPRSSISISHPTNIAPSPAVTPRSPLFPYPYKPPHPSANSRFSKKRLPHPPCFAMCVLIKDLLRSVRDVCANKGLSYLSLKFSRVLLPPAFLRAPDPSGLRASALKTHPCPIPAHAHPPQFSGPSLLLCLLFFLLPTLPHAIVPHHRKYSGGIYGQ